MTACFLCDRDPDNEPCWSCIAAAGAPPEQPPPNLFDHDPEEE